MTRLSLMMLLAAGCSSTPATGMDMGSAADQGGSGMQRLVTQDYMLPAGQEIYTCKRVTLTEDVWMHAITPVNGQATHHEVLAIDPDKTSPDGIEAPCNPLQPKWQMLFASGVNSPTLTMPDGVAVRVHAGDQIVFQLHLLNASPAAITSSASLDIVAADPATVQNEAEMILAGPPPVPGIGPSIPVGDNQIINGTCTMSGATNYYAVFPHMHMIGKHIKVSTVVGGTTSVIYDGDYSFTEQLFKSFTPIPMAKGDQIKVQCTYNNTTGAAVNLGESSTDEMCFAISYRYPKVSPNAQFGALCPR